MTLFSKVETKYMFRDPLEFIGSMLNPALQAAAALACCWQVYDTRTLSLQLTLSSGRLCLSWAFA